MQKFIPPGMFPASQGVDVSSQDEKKPPVGGVVDARWMVDVSAGGVLIQRINDEGLAVECYGPVPPGQAALRLAAIVNGFEPPRGLRPVQPLGAAGY